MGRFAISNVVFGGVPLTNARFDEIDYGIGLNERRGVNGNVKLQGVTKTRPTIILRCYTDETSEIRNLIKLVNTRHDLEMTRTIDGESVTRAYENCKICSLRMKPSADFRDFEYWIGFKIDSTEIQEVVDGDFSI
jgi:hypothetical protein